jgi:hypothetical protein
MDEGGSVVIDADRDLRTFAALYNKLNIIGLSLQRFLPKMGQFSFCC